MTAAASRSWGVAGAGRGSTSSDALPAPPLCTTIRRWPSHSHAMAEIRQPSAPDCSMVRRVRHGQLPRHEHGPGGHRGRAQPAARRPSRPTSRWPGSPPTSTPCMRFTVFAPENSAFAKLSQPRHDDDAQPRRANQRSSSITWSAAMSRRLELAHGMSADHAGGRLAQDVQDGLGLRGEQRRRDLRQHPRPRTRPSTSSTRSCSRCTDAAGQPGAPARAARRRRRAAPGVARPCGRMVRSPRAFRSRCTPGWPVPGRLPVRSGRRADSAPG